LGALLLDYLHLYGLRFNMDRVGMSSRWGGMYFEKESIGTQSVYEAFSY